MRMMITGCTRNSEIKLWSTDTWCCLQVTHNRETHTCHILLHLLMFAHVHSLVPALVLCARAHSTLCSPFSYSPAPVSSLLSGDQVDDLSVLLTDHSFLCARGHACMQLRITRSFIVVPSARKLGTRLAVHAPLASTHLAAKQPDRFVTLLL